MQNCTTQIDTPISKMQIRFNLRFQNRLSVFKNKICTNLPFQNRLIDFRIKNHAKSVWNNKLQNNFLNCFSLTSVYFFPLDTHFASTSTTIRPHFWPLSCRCTQPNRITILQTVRLTHIVIPDRKPRVISETFSRVFTTIVYPKNWLYILYQTSLQWGFKHPQNIG
jgi:hypothetical protein